MKDALRHLVRLQDLMRTAEEHAEKIAAVPAEVARLEKDLLAVQEEAEKDRAALEDLQKERRRLESELMGVESKIQKYQGQLMEIKTNKEYQAALKEIESCRAERAALDEKILMEMEQAEKRNSDFQAIENRLQAKRRETEEGKRRLTEELETLKQKKTEVEGERDRVSAGIPAGYLEPFLKVARQRKGLALVPVRDELCGGCHVRVMPTLIQQVRRAERLVSCDSCKRFLYVPEDFFPPATPAPEPTAR